MTNTGDSPDDPSNVDRYASWLAAGYSATDAATWANWGFTLEQAASWRGAGVQGATEARQWATVGATPHSVGDWKSAGLTAAEALRWHAFGYGLTDAIAHRAEGRSPQDAYEQAQDPSEEVVSFSGAVGRRRVRGSAVERFLQHGITRRLLESYVTRGWLDDEALGWALQDIDADHAILWKILGVPPREAARIARRESLDAVVGEWLGTGVPLAEVADWLEAGFTAGEAAAERRRGRSAEQAAARRRTKEPPAS